MSAIASENKKSVSSLAVSLIHALLLGIVVASEKSVIAVFTEIKKDPR